MRLIEAILTFSYQILFLDYIANVYSKLWLIQTYIANTREKMVKENSSRRKKGVSSNKLPRQLKENIIIRISFKQKSNINCNFFISSLINSILFLQISKNAIILDSLCDSLYLDYVVTSCYSDSYFFRKIWPFQEKNRLQKFSRNI